MELDGIVEYFDNLKDDDIVKIKISYLTCIFSIYKNDLFNPENEELLNVLLSKMNLAILLLKKHVNYMDIPVSEAKYLLRKTSELNINKDMVVVLNRCEKNRYKTKGLKNEKEYFG